MCILHLDNKQSNLLGFTVAGAGLPQFGINLSTLVECLKIFSGSADSSLHITFNSSSACLSLTLVEGNVVTNCTIHTMDTEPEQAREPC